MGKHNLFIFILSTLLTKTSNAVEYNYEGNFIIKIKKMNTPDILKYNILLNQGSWRDSLGDTGTAFCHGKVETLITGNFNLEVICENTNEKMKSFG